MQWTSLVILILCLFSVHVQTDAQGRKRQMKKKVDKTWLIDLQYNNEFYYKSFFQDLEDDELVLQSLVPNLDGRYDLTETRVLLDDYEYIRIKNRKETFRNSVLAGVLVGAASFFIVKEISRNKEPGNLAPINQSGTSGTVEGSLAAGIGFGFGILFYDSAFNKRIKISSNREEVLDRLRLIKL